MRRTSSILALFALSCAPKTPTKTDGTRTETGLLAVVHPLNQVRGLRCDGSDCTLSTIDGLVRFSADSGAITQTDKAPIPSPDPWPKADVPTPLNESWNSAVANRWRSPFLAEIPAPDGGFFRAHRGATPGTSRVMRLGGSVVTARIGLDPGHPAYPNTLALHPTGQEAYHIVWPNPDLIAFNARTLETTWRIRLGGPALGLFVSADGRYLVAELDGKSPEHQLLDYEPTRLSTPDGMDPTADETLLWLERPAAERTALVDLTVGKVVAVLPGRAVGFSRVEKGAVIASTGGVAAVAWAVD